MAGWGAPPGPTQTAVGGAVGDPSRGRQRGRGSRCGEGLFTNIPDHRPLRTSAFANSDAWFLIRSSPPDPRSLPERHELLVSRGPYDLDGERALMSGNRIDALVTKNSGGPMTSAKLDAAAELGVDVVMIERPPLPPECSTVGTVDEAVDWIRRLSRDSAAE